VAKNGENVDVFGVILEDLLELVDSGVEFTLLSIGFTELGLRFEIVGVEC